MIEVGSFRARARAWLVANADSYKHFEASDTATARQFRAALWDAGLLGITLDQAYGGQGLTAEHQRAWDEEAGGYRLPPIGEAVTTGICAPTLLDFGTEEQKRDPPSSHDAGRRGVDAAAVRAGGRLGSGRSADAGGPRRRRVPWSTARRSGRREHSVGLRPVRGANRPHVDRSTRACRCSSST